MTPLYTHSGLASDLVRERVVEGRLEVWAIAIAGQSRSTALMTAQAASRLITAVLLCILMVFDPVEACFIVRRKWRKLCSISHLGKGECVNPQVPGSITG